MPPIAVTATDEAAAVRNRRRVGDTPERMTTAIGPPPLIRGGPCLSILTTTQNLCDEWMNREPVPVPPNGGIGLPMVVAIRRKHGRPGTPDSSAPTQSP